MQGAHAAKAFVNEYLKNDLPRRVMEFRNGERKEGRWFLDDETLPTPESFLTYEPLALDVWPTIITLAVSSQNMSRANYTKDRLYDPMYDITYNMRTYVWVRAEGSEECTLMRDRLTTVVRSALLDYPCLKASDEESYLQAMVDEGTMREEFSDLTLLKGDRVLAGAFIAYELVVNELVTRVPIGFVTDIDITPQIDPDNPVPPPGASANNAAVQVEVNNLGYNMTREV
jgi:hypothetical protein